MTPVEIAYFKHFLFDKALARTFQYFYHTRPVKESMRGNKDVNPESIEQYLLQTSVKDVIMKAFTFYLSGTAIRENATFDYWKNVDDQWQQYMSSMANNFTNDSWPQLGRTFAILRQNWDIPAYWKKDNLESTEEVYKRMHIDLPLPENCWEHGWNPRQRPDTEPAAVPAASAEGLNSAVVPATVPTAAVPEASASGQSSDPLAEYDFFEDILPGQYRLKSNEISVNFNKSNKITFNQVDSKVIRDSSLKYARLAKNKSNDICLIINSQKGATVTNLSGRAGNMNATINSVDICKKLRTLFNLKSDYSILTVERLQVTQEFIIYKITKQ